MSDAWPFLVSRNRVRDYQPLVAPGFLIDKRGTGQLIGLPVGGSDGAGTRRETHLDKTPGGRLTAVYRAVEAKLNGEVLRDMAGRPILRIEGVVVRGGTSAARVPETILEEVHRVVEPDFQSFWNTTERAQIRRSAPIPLPADSKQGPDSRAKKVLLALIPTSIVLFGISCWLAAEVANLHQGLTAQAEARQNLAAEVVDLRQQLDTQTAARDDLMVEAMNLRQQLNAQTTANEELAAEVAKLQAGSSGSDKPNR